MKGIIYLLYVYIVRGHLIHWDLKGHGKDVRRPGNRHGYELAQTHDHEAQL
jgi:hypothetical protein